MAKRNLHDYVVGGCESGEVGALLVNSVTDERLRFTRTAEETDGRLLQAEFVAPPGWRQPGRLQSHLKQEERIQVLSGSLRVRSGGAGHILDAGGSLTIPPGTAHAVTNEGSEEVRATLEWRPALGTQTFFETFVGLAREGRLRPTPRNVLQLTVWLYGFRREVRPAGACGTALAAGVAATRLAGRVAGASSPLPPLQYQWRSDGAVGGLARARSGRRGCPEVRRM